MIYTIGESVLDIIIKNYDQVKIRPGGSMLNTAISLGRLGINVQHISYLSDDITAQSIINFLKENGVGVDGLLQKAKQTNLALAFLNEKNNANYVFYKDKIENDIDFKFPEVKEGDIILFGSFFSLNPFYRKSLIHFLKDAKNKNTLIIYDPNFRKPHLSDLKKLTPFILENFALADVIKASDEDFKTMFNIKDGASCWEFLKPYKTQLLFYTQGGNNSECYWNNGKTHLAPQKTEIISTIGAGDTFSAGIIFWLTSNGISKNDFFTLPDNKLKNALHTANSFAAHVCNSFDNYLSNDFIKQWKHVQ